MTADAVLAQARERTGLNNFGSMDFVERLEIWMQSIDEDRGLNRLGRAGAFEQIVRYAACRLQLEDRLRRHPEITDIIIDRPVIIAGLPRSGTTHLVNILATNPGLRSMKLWEAMEPVPKDEDISFADDDTNPRYRRAVEGWHVLTRVLRYWEAMHEMAPDHIHEEVELQCLDFSSYMIDWLARVPRWQQYYYDHDQTPHYAYSKKVLQAMTHLKGPNRWLMKSPPNMENLGPVMTTYPDCTLVITHRDPVAVIQSAITMMAYWDRIRRHEADLPGLAMLWINRIERLLKACVKDRDALPQNQVLDVYFHEYMRDQRGTVGRIYQLSGLAMTAEAAQQIDNYLTVNPRGKLGQVVYDPIGDFGIDIKALRQRFAFYYDRFPVKQEPVIGE
jgi:Sulfotransferase family